MVAGIENRCNWFRSEGQRYFATPQGHIGSAFGEQVKGLRMVLAPAGLACQFRLIVTTPLTLPAPPRVFSRPSASASPLSSEFSVIVKSPLTT
jgi:hypothetical protein